MAITNPTISDVYKDTQEIKTQLNNVSQKVDAEDVNIKNLINEVKKLSSPPMIG